MDVPYAQNQSHMQAKVTPFLLSQHLQAVFPLACLKMALEAINLLYLKG